MNKKILTLTAAFFIACITTANAEVFWSSPTVKSGDIGMVYGEDISADSLKISRLEDGTTSNSPSFVSFAKPDKPASEYDTYANKVTPSWNSGNEAETDLIQNNEKSFKFIVPESFDDGIYVVETNGVKQYINAPYIKWVQGDGGETATPGGWIRITGENISFGEKTPKVVLVDSQNNVKTLTVTKIYDSYSIEARIPISVGVGTYDVYVHNGYGDDTAWSMPCKTEVRAAVTKSEKIFDVTDYGAVGDGYTDDTSAVRKAINQAAKNGGGTVYFPSGRYLFTGTFKIPVNTAIKGEDKTLVSLVFLPYNWSIGNIPDAFFTGTKNFSVEDLTINATRMNKCITSEFAKNNSENITVKNVNILANPFVFYGPNDETRAIITSEMGNYTDTTRAAIYLGGNNIKVENCRVLGGANPIMIFDANGVVVRNNEFYNGYMGWYAINGSQNVIFEDNSITGTDLMSGGGGIANYNRSLTQNVYFARNKLSKFFTNDREAMTTDGATSAYMGTMSSVSGNTITLSTTPSWGKSDWTGAGLMIMSGTGNGQYRIITGYNDNVVNLDYAFEVEPDETSKIIIVGMNRKGIYTDNSFEDTGILQFYGIGIDNIINGNQFTRSAGIKLYGFYTYGGYRPSWYNYLTNNHFKEGYYTHWFGTNDGLSGESSIWVNAAVYSQKPETVLIATNISNNTFDNHSGIKFISSYDIYALTKDAILQNNTIKNSDIGIKTEGMIDGIVLKNNSFENVKNEYDIADATQAEYY